MNRFMDKIKQNKKIQDVLFIILILAVFTISFIVWGNKKCISFCDEVYTYILSNSDSEFLINQLEPNRWYVDGEVGNILSATEGFQFHQVMVNNKGDVHPPMYYFVIHFLSVLNPGNCSKWIALFANWMFSVVSLIVLYQFIKELTGSRAISCCMGVIYIASTAIVSMNMLLRMYSMFSMWTILFIYILYKLWQDSGRYWAYAALALITFFAFLTQYYFAVFCVLISGCYGIYCIVKKKWKELFLYAGGLVCGVILATVFWKTWIRHMFSGYLGGAVMENAFNFARILDDFKYAFLHLFTLMFGPVTCWIVGIALVVGIVVLFVKKDNHVWGILALALTAFGYSVAVEHLTPAYLLNYRYFFPVLAIMYMAILLLVYYVARQFIKKPVNVTIAFSVLFALLSLVLPLYEPNAVSYVDVYGKYSQSLETLAENSDVPWVYFGYENSAMADLIYNSLMSKKFMLINYDSTFDEPEYTQNNSELLLFAEAGTNFEQDAKDKMQEVLGGKVEFVRLTNVGELIAYKVIHSVK